MNHLLNLHGVVWDAGVLLLHDVREAASKFVFQNKSKSHVNKPEQPFLDSFASSTNCTRKEKNERKEDRLRVSLPIEFSNANYFTHDVSASGVFIEADAPLKIGEQIDFSILVGSKSGKLKLNCHGEIVRADVENGKAGFAIKFI